MCTTSQYRKIVFKICNTKSCLNIEYSGFVIDARHTSHQNTWRTPHLEVVVVGGGGGWVVVVKGGEGLSR